MYNQNKKYATCTIICQYLCIHPLFLSNFIFRCTCGNCQIMPTPRESVRCNEIVQVYSKIEEVHDAKGGERLSCITSFDAFNSVCLNRWVLQTAWFQHRAQYQNHYQGPQHKINRHVAYQQLARWCWGFLGKEVRVVLPSCAVCSIRAHFPPPGDEEDFADFSFVGFKDIN